MKHNPLLLDIMEGDRFIDQMSYPKRGFPKMVDGVITEAYDIRDIEQFVFDKRPSLRNRNIRIEFSTQRVV